MLVAAIGIVGALALLLGPFAQWATVAITDLKGKEKADAVNATRQTLLAAAGGTFALIGIGFTARTYYLSRRGQFTDRYTKAIDQLASEKTTERLGGIYALEHLMTESERDHTTVVEVLAAFIREQTHTGQGMFPQPEHIHQGPQPAYRTLAIDVQAALTALGRRPQRPERNPVNLSSADLCGADLANLRLDRADLWGTKLRDSIMHNVQLRGANLSYAQLQDSRLGGAQLQGAHFFRARMQEVTLDHAQLQDANLRQAQLQDSNLHDANLQGAKLNETNLQGANLSNRASGQPAPVHGLTAEQLVHAVLDDKTQLPAALHGELLQRQRQQLYDALVRYHRRLSE
ncbi:pentapeptide repeat-containing protein [Amycolatopsis ultiminotia]|uniref:Pentapeptide repeat-containing protein n=1 Tax=Amycolatopsis ultiminotia TaxID=543629 RepID=A0ABP6VY89_9PSEU